MGVLPLLTDLEDEFACMKTIIHFLSHESRNCLLAICIKEVPNWITLKCPISIFRSEHFPFHANAQVFYSQIGFVNFFY